MTLKTSKVINVNDMIQKLCDKSIGCYVGDVYCGCVMNADDLIPVSASVNLLQRMIRHLL